VTSGGELVAEVLARHGVRFLFTLCGGHISPILAAAKARGIRVVDTRHEATAVFAADAVARQTGVPGVAAVTAGPGVTNAVTALQNARLAQSPLVLLGGATATVLRGRGALQDIDQLAFVRPIVKWATAVTKVRDLVPSLERAFAISREGVPGPVFVECPVDLLYDEALVRGWYGGKSGEPKGLVETATKWYLGRHLDAIFADADESVPRDPAPVPELVPEAGSVGTTALLLARSERPVLVLGSGALSSPAGAADLARAVAALRLPTWLSGTARGLLGGSVSSIRRQRVTGSSAPFPPSGEPSISASRAASRSRRRLFHVARGKPAGVPSARARRKRPGSPWTPSVGLLFRVSAFASRLTETSVAPRAIWRP